MRIHKRQFRIRSKQSLVAVVMGVVLCSAVVGMDVVHAQTVSVPVVNIPLEIGIGNIRQVASLSDYIIKLYRFIVGFIGIAAAVMIMVNGLRWAAASGNSEQVSTAKDGITSAIIGLLIALGSYVILNTLNPALVNLQDVQFQQPAVPAEQTASTSNVPVSIQCASNKNLVNIQSREAIPESLQQYYTFKSSYSEPCLADADYQAFLHALQRLQSAREGDYYYGMRLHLNSVYRTQETQDKFYACYQYYDQNHVCPTNLNINGTPFNCLAATECNLAGKTSKHGNGDAMDMGWYPVQGQGKYVSTTGDQNNNWHNTCMANRNPSCDQSKIQSVIKMNEFMEEFGFKHLCVEFWHMQLNPSGTCSAGTYTVHK